MIRAHLCNLCSMLSHKKVYAHFDLTYSRNLLKCLCTKELRHGRSQRGTSRQPPVWSPTPALPKRGGGTKKGSSDKCVVFVM